MREKYLARNYSAPKTLRNSRDSAIFAISEIHEPYRWKMKPIEEIIQQDTLRLPPIPEFQELETLRQFAVNRWTLGRIHGVSHWRRVERNGLILSLKNGRDGWMFRENINLKVVRMFAYLHDACRADDGYDVEHGARAAGLVMTLRDSLLKCLTDEEVALLKRACCYHTTVARTGQPTIDVCFDADRLDLGRVGIVPDPQKMATEQGKYFAAHPNIFNAFVRNLHNV